MFVTRQEFSASANDILFRRRCTKACNHAVVSNVLQLPHPDLKNLVCASVALQRMAGPNRLCMISLNPMSAHQPWMEILYECQHVSSHMGF